MTDENIVEIIEGPPAAPTAQDGMLENGDIELRRLTYQQIADPVFFQWQRGDATKEDWLAAVQRAKEIFAQARQDDQT